MSVIIIGCGIAGPVLAMLLKHKGFETSIYEAFPGMIPGGLNIGLSPQSFKVLDIIGLAETVMKQGIVMEKVISSSALQERKLAESDAPQQLRAQTGWPMLTIGRSTYRDALYHAAVDRGIPVHFGKRLTDVEQTNDKVTAIFEDGTKVEGDLLVGCDGLHSAVRNALFGKEPVRFTGIVQVGGDSPIPDFMKPPAPASMYQVFGNGVDFLTAVNAKDNLFWVTTMATSVEAREDWKAVSIADAQEVLKNLPTASWTYGPSKEIIANATRVIQYGLYDRPVSPVWHKGRVVLCGDAAHPTGPHVGQGANQSLVDCYHLVRLLVQHGALQNESLEQAFTEFEQLRIPVVTKVIEAAKKEGEKRVLRGEEACNARDDAIFASQTHAVLELWKEQAKSPFEGKSEI